MVSKLRFKREHNLFFCPIYFWLLGLLVFSSAWGKDTFKYQVNSSDQLEIHGFRGKLTFTDRKIDKKNLTIVIKGARNVEEELLFESRNEGWRYKIENTDKKILLRILGPNDRDKWIKTVNGGSGSDIEIFVSGKSVPVKSTWKSGRMVFSGWEASVKSYLQQGSFISTNGKGSLQLVRQQGETRIADHDGSVNLDSYRGQFAMSNAKGDMYISHFSGEAVFNNIEGLIDMDSHEASMRVVEGNGRVHFANGSGNVVVKNFSGSIEGKTDGGPIFLKTKDKPDIRVRSLNGKITVDVPPDSGARINVGTRAGVLYTPKYLKLQRYPNIKVVQGRLEGNAPGRVFVRTDDGPVIVR